HVSALSRVPAGRQRGDVPSRLRRRRIAASRSADHSARAGIRLLHRRFLSRPARTPRRRPGLGGPRPTPAANIFATVIQPRFTAAYMSPRHRRNPRQPMTPEARNLVTDLSDRRATLEDAQRDRDAERLIQDGLRQAPNAPYALVQTVLVQDEALKRAEARIRELENQLGGTEPPQQGGFLDSVRNGVWGRRDPQRPGSVPTVRPPGTPMGVPPEYRAEAQPAAAPGPQPGTGGGSFLGTAAAAAAGVIGGSLLLNGIRSMMGHGGGGGTAHAAVDPAVGSASPWGGTSSGGGDLARQAGIDDIGRSPGGRDDAGAGRGYGIAVSVGKAAAGQD